MVRYNSIKEGAALKRLQELRMNRKLTQLELANILNVSRNTVSRYEIGNREPDYDTLNQLAELFEVSIDYLLGRTTDPSPPNMKKETPAEMSTEAAVIAYFVQEKGRKPSKQELDLFIAFTKPVLDSLPDKAD